jgi:BirA family biotin operon repressor/biotin-[acetyl-CoA-carboxylase] ligase
MQPGEVTRGLMDLAEAWDHSSIRFRVGKIVYNYSMDQIMLQASLKGLPIPAVRWFDIIGSTNDEATNWAAQGAPDGSLVAANQQTGGRGRMGRKWISLPGGSLSFSLVLRPTTGEITNLALISALGALAVSDALNGLGLASEVKWPNDVLLSRRKVCGILAEATWVGEELLACVLGVGVNIAHSSVPPAEELLFPATCVEEFATPPVKRFELLYQILKAFFTWRSHLGEEEFLKEWEKRLAFKGERVSVSPPGGQSVMGILNGIDPQGGVRLTTPDGKEVSLSAGDLHLRSIIQP